MRPQRWLLLLLLLAASTAGAAPPPGALVLGPGPGDRSAEINQALEALRERGGGVVHLLPGRYHLARPLRIASSYGKDGRVRAAMHVGLQGATPPSGYGDAATTLVYDGAAHAPSFLSIADDEDAVFAINSFSKPWAMTGWRIGWLTHPKSVEGAAAAMAQTRPNNAQPQEPASAPSANGV